MQFRHMRIGIGNTRDQITLSYNTRSYSNRTLNITLVDGINSKVKTGT